MTSQLDKPLADRTGAGSPEIPDSVRQAMNVSVKRRVSRRRRNTLIVRGGQIGSLVITLLLWQWAVDAGLVRELFVSKPTSVLTYFGDEYPVLLENAWATFSAALVGFLIGSTSGVAFGVAVSRWRTLERITEPWITFLNSLPRIALAPLFLLWFGITFQAKVALAVSVVFFIVLVGTQAGMRSSDPDLVRAVRLLGGSSRQALVKVIFPAALPAIFGALRLGVVFSILGVVASEMVASREGLGQLIVRASQELVPQGVFAMLILLGVVGTMINVVLRAIEDHFLGWKSEVPSI